MPGSGHVGFELFDRTTFGATDFQEHVNYQRALEGELARTISSISEVAGARVHIAMPKPSLFVGQEQPTKASVVLKLRSNRKLQASTAATMPGWLRRPSNRSGPRQSCGQLRASTVQAGEQGRSQRRRSSASSRSSDLSMRVVDLLEPIVAPAGCVSTSAPG
jgi:flagellar M-ring protein FliF